MNELFSLRKFKVLSHHIRRTGKDLGNVGGQRPLLLEWCRREIFKLQTFMYFSKNCHGVINLETCGRCNSAILGKGYFKIQIRLL